MYIIIITLSIILTISLLLFIKFLIKKEMIWREWKSDIRKMGINYVKSRVSINKTNQKYHDYMKLYEKETNPQEKARLLELAKKEHIKSEIKWAEHDMNHSATYEEIRRKYTNK